MSEWNAMTYEGKDTILRVVREEAERFFALAERRRRGRRRPPARAGRPRDVVGHIVDTTEGYFRAFDAARGSGRGAGAARARRDAEQANEGAGVP